MVSKIIVHVSKEYVFTGIVDITNLILTYFFKIFQFILFFILFG